MGGDISHQAAVKEKPGVDRAFYPAPDDAQPIQCLDTIPLCQALPFQAVELEYAGKHHGGRKESGE
jgi:hypothetical protein